MLCTTTLWKQLSKLRCFVSFKFRHINHSIQFTAQQYLFLSPFFLLLKWPKRNRFEQLMRLTFREQSYWLQIFFDFWQRTLVCFLWSWSIILKLVPKKKTSLILIMIFIRQSIVFTANGRHQNQNRWICFSTVFNFN